MLECHCSCFSAVFARRLLGLNSAAQLGFLSVSAAFSGLVFSAECAESGSLFRKRMLGGAELLYIGSTVLFCALALFTKFGAAIVCGGTAVYGAEGASAAVCGVKGLYAAVPALVLLLLWEGVKLLVRTYKKREAALEGEE